MIVDLSGDVPAVLDPGNCRQLKVVAPMALDVDQALRASGMGSETPGGGVVLDATLLRSAARAGATDPEWDAQWDAMVAYAATKGWVTPDGRGLLAHVEREAAPTP